MILPVRSSRRRPGRAAVRALAVTAALLAPAASTADAASPSTLVAAASPAVEAPVAVDIGAEAAVVDTGAGTVVAGHAASPSVGTRQASTDTPPSRTATGWRSPVAGDVVAHADLPAAPWLPGHRGVDLASAVGEPVLTPAAGVVTFAGPVAGRPLVVVSHGELRSTLEPVDATVEVGTVLAAGEPVGTTSATGSHCAPAACLHWGVRRGDDYLDPLTLLGRAVPIVLLPLG